MRGLRQRHSHRYAIGAAALILSFIAGAVAPTRAHAGFTTCQSDPIVTLSNGVVIDLRAGIGDNVSDVRRVDYSLHVPTGTRTISVVNTDGLIGLVENVRIYADDSPGTYDASTVVTTGAAAADVQASATAVSALGLALASGSATGMNGQALLVHLTAPSWLGL